jgi:hypothetical protein
MSDQEEKLKNKIAKMQRELEELKQNPTLNLDKLEQEYRCKLISFGIKGDVLQQLETIVSHEKANNRCEDVLVTETRLAYELVLLEKRLMKIISGKN